MKRVLTIAGSDSGGGAGIQADLKTFAALKVYGLSAVTAITAQNTLGVQGIVELPPEFVAKQIESVVMDIGVDAVKTGMLFSSGIIAKVSKTLRKFALGNLVVDPVMIAKGGAPLLREEAREALKKLLVPLAYLVTPNLSEAEILSGQRIENTEDMKEVALTIYEQGAKNVLLKGGHLKGSQAIDLLFDGREFTIFSSLRYETKNTHGTGCVYSAAITAELAKGKSLKEAIGIAKDLISNSIKYSLSLGQGQGPVNPLASLYREIERQRVIAHLQEAFQRLKESSEVVLLLPEVQSNLVMALSDAESIDEVAGFPGRIIKFKNELRTFGDPEFGASSHLARVVLAAKKHSSAIRAAMNIRYSEDILKTCERLGYTISCFERTLEPEEVKKIEGSTLEWGTDMAIKALGAIPDIIYDRGERGKEAMIRILGKDALEVVEKVIKIANSLFWL